MKKPIQRRPVEVRVGHERVVIHRRTRQERIETLLANVAALDLDRFLPDALIGSPSLLSLVAEATDLVRVGQQAAPMVDKTDGP